MNPTTPAAVLISIAFIGLLGVVVGGLIQISFQAIKAARDSRHEARREIAEYATDLALALDMLDDLVFDYENRMDDTYEPRLATKARTNAFEQLRKLMPKLHGTHASLIASADHRIGKIAARSNNQFSDAIHTVWWAINTNNDIDVKEFNRSREGLQTNRKLLVSMVAPRPVETTWFFRSEKSARKRIATLEKAEAIE